MPASGSRSAREAHANCVKPTPVHTQTESEARSAWSARRGAGPGSGRWAGFHGQEALALEPLTRELAGAADGLGFLTRFLFGGFLVMTAQLHLSEDALALHLFLERLEGLIDI